MELVASQIADNATHAGSGEGADLLGQEADQLSFGSPHQQGCHWRLPRQQSCPITTMCEQRLAD